MIVEMTIGGRYNWKNQPERLVYIGKKGAWHQFEKVDAPGTVWCEVLDEDLHMLEETKEPEVNSELERDTFRKFMVSNYNWPDGDEYWELNAKGDFIIDDIEDTFVLFRDARAALSTEAQPEVTGAVEHEGMTIAGGEETLAELGALIKDGHKNRGGPQGHA